MEDKYSMDQDGGHLGDDSTHCIYCSLYFVIIKRILPQISRHQAPEAEDPCSMAVPCSTWLVSVELTLVAAPSSSSCLVPSTPVSHLWEGTGGVSVSDLQSQNLPGSGHWCGGLSRRFSCFCVFPQKREPRPLGRGRLALDTCGYEALHHPPYR